MAAVNKVILLGNLGADPVIRQTSDGRNIASLNIATTDSWKDKDGNKQDRTEWHRVSVFGPLADIVSRFLKKGASVYFEGRLQTRKYTNQAGQEVYTTEIVVDQRGVMQMLGGRSDNTSSSEGYSAPAQSASKPAAVSNEEAFDDDIPF